MDTIRLDRSEAPYLPSPKVLQAIHEVALKINRYPEVFGGSLPDALAIYTGKLKEQIVVGNGSDDLIELILKILVSPNEQVLIPIPTFPWYWYAAKNLARKIIFIKRNTTFGLDVDCIVQNITPKTKVIFIANPNNPTANLIPRKTLIKLIEQISCLVVVDECYYEFSQETLADLIDVYSNLIVLRSFSKGFALAGVRVGYAITHIELASYLRSSTQLFGINAFAQTAAIAALSDLEYYHTQIEQVRSSRKQLVQGLERLGLNVYPSTTNFLFVETKDLNITASCIEAKLHNNNIFVKNCSDFLGLNDFYFRTSVSNTIENQALLRNLAKIKVEI